VDKALNPAQLEFLGGREYGGQGRGPVERWLFAEELYDRRLPNGLLTLNAIGPTLIRLR
jgi:hypothetical protein